MGKIYDTKIDDGIATFTFSNSDGDIFASFRMNPSNPKIAARIEETEDFWNGIEQRLNNAESAVETAKLADEIEEKFKYILGEKACENLFSELIPVTTIFPNGEPFLFVILDKIITFVKPEMEKRNKNAAKAIEKYTRKYT